jgi:hypothetical protein
MRQNSLGVPINGLSLIMTERSTPYLVSALTSDDVGDDDLSAVANGPQLPRTAAEGAVLEGNEAIGGRREAAHPAEGVGVGFGRGGRRTGLAAGPPVAIRSRTLTDQL